MEAIKIIRKRSSSLALKSLSEFKRNNPTNRKKYRLKIGSVTLQDELYI